MVTHLMISLLLCAFCTPFSMAQSTNNAPHLPLQYEHGKTIIPFCTSFPLIGENSIIGRQMLAGVENYLREFKHFTSEVEGTQATLILKHIKNNKDIDDKGLECISSMLPLSPLIIGLIGHETIASLIPDLNNNKLLLLFPLEGDPMLRAQTTQNVIYFRPSSEKELDALVDYTIKTKHKKSIAILYESSSWGKNLLETLKKILDAHNIIPVATAPYAQGTVDVDTALQTIAKATPNAVFCLAHPRPAYAFISNALNVGLHESLFLGLSPLAVIQKLLKKARGLDIAVSSVVPNAATSKLPIVQEYKQAMKTFLSFRDDSPFYFEAFINLAVLEHCLKRIKGPLSISSIINTLQAYTQVDFKGLKLSFDEQERALSSALWINPGIDREWIDYAENI